MASSPSTRRLTCIPSPLRSRFTVASSPRDRPIDISRRDFLHRSSILMDHQPLRLISSPSSPNLKAIAAAAGSRSRGGSRFVMLLLVVVVKVVCDASCFARFGLTEGFSQLELGGVDDI
jgi:hypothetical protein